MLKAAFIFIAPEAEPQQHRSLIETPMVQLTVVGVKSYEAAAQVTNELVNQGIEAIELCGGFGVDGVAKVKQATGGKAVIGVVRFDNHPGLGGKSGDDVF